MKFETEDKHQDLKIVGGKFVQPPMARFADHLESGVRERVGGHRQSQDLVASSEQPALAGTKVVYGEFALG